MTPDPVPDDFVCWQCGNCCRGDGYVRVGEAEVERLADYLGLAVEAFTERYTRLGAGRLGLLLTERANRDCIFLREDGTCCVYPARADQCANFPHSWNYRGWLKYCENRCSLEKRPGEKGRDA